MAYLGADRIGARHVDFHSADVVFSDWEHILVRKDTGNVTTVLGRREANADKLYASFLMDELTL